MEFLWRVVAWVCGLPPVAWAIIRYAQRTPYSHLYEYMNRWWLFNAWDEETHVNAHPRFSHSARVHHILRADLDRDKHDHPWRFRTIILRGWYVERRESPQGDVLALRKRGQTAVLAHGEFRKIDAVSDGGVWTLFITGPKLSSWGFMTPKGWVRWKDYEGTHTVVSDNQRSRYDAASPWISP